MESAPAQLDAQLLRLKTPRCWRPDAASSLHAWLPWAPWWARAPEMFKPIRQGRLSGAGGRPPSWLHRPGHGGVGHRPRRRSKPMGPGPHRGLRWTPQTRNGLVYVDLQACPTARRFQTRYTFARGEFELARPAPSRCRSRPVVVRDGFSFVACVGADSKVKQMKVQTDAWSATRLKCLRRRPGQAGGQRRQLFPTGTGEGRGLGIKTGTSPRKCWVFAATK